MLKKSTIRLAVFLVIGVLILTACTPGATLPAEEIKPTTDSTSETAVSTDENSPTDEVSVTETPTEVTPEPTPIPIVDNRLPPEQWQQWPVVPELTGREKEIYLRGLSLGNDPNSFSKVGDCQAIKEVLMGIYDLNRYSLAESDTYCRKPLITLPVRSTGMVRASGVDSTPLPSFPRFGRTPRSARLAKTPSNVKTAPTTPAL